MTESEGLLEKLREAETALGKDERKAALGILVDIREAGFVSRELDKKIGELRDSDADLGSISAWIRDAIDRVSSFGGDVFRDLVDLGEQSLGVEADEWVTVDAGSDDEFNLFDDEDFADVIGEVDQGGLSEPSLGSRLKESTGKFKLPSPSTKKVPQPESEAIPDIPREGTGSSTVAAEVPGPSDPIASDAADDVDLDFGFEDPFAELAEESDLRELTPLRGIESVSREPTPPQPQPVRRQGFDSGPSQARYAGVEPPPPRHRMRGEGAPSEAGLDFSFSDSEPDDDDGFEFDLGLDNPNARPFGGANTSIKAESLRSNAADDDDDFEFDLGLEPPENNFNPGAQSPARSLQATPMGMSLDEKSEPLPEDEFFMLAEELASDAELVGDEEPNEDFVHSKPTGTAQQPIVEDSFVLEEASAAESAPVGTATNLSAILLEARRMFQQGDLNAALNVCEKVLSRNTADEEALELKLEVEKSLESVHLGRLGSLESVPTLAVNLSELAGMSLDHRAGFLLSQLDGMMVLEDILEISSMSRYETLSLLVDLLDRGVVKV